MTDGSGAADRGAEPSAASSSQPLTPDVQTASSQQQQLAKPTETPASSESSPNSVGNLISTTASNTL